MNSFAIMEKGRRLVALAINRIGALRCREKMHLFQKVADPHHFLSLTLYEVMQVVRRRLRTRHFNLQRYLLEAEQDFAYCSAHHIAILTLPDLPQSLREIHDPPFLLFVRGQLPKSEFVLGVVGTRRPSAAGIGAAQAIGRECAAAGITLVSGLAIGIDSLAMQSAHAHQGRLIAVLGNGIDSVYPRQNRDLAEALVDAGGTILSEYPPGSAPDRYHFPARNRIICGLSPGVVLVEAPERSGALITADFALQEGRDLFVHALPLNSERNAGARQLAASGAPIIASLSEALAHCRDITPPRIPESSRPTTVDRTTLAAVTDSPTAPALNTTGTDIPAHHHPAHYLVALLREELTSVS